jgi:hypothetical protein
MKLDPKTLAVLKNFTTIQQGILIREGDVLSTVSSTKTIACRAKVPDTFPCEAAIYNLAKLLNVLSLFEEPDLEFKEDYLFIRSGNSTIRYKYCEPKYVMAGPMKDFPMPSADIQFELTDSTMTQLTRATAVLSAPDFALVGEDGTMTLRTINFKDQSGDMFSVDVGTTTKNFTVIFKPEQLKLLPRTYQVTVTQAGFAKFQAPDISYWVAFEKDSSIF